ncbi:MAG: T9SS type A sorting domain-containing protein [Coprobacter sp.]
MAVDKSIVSGSDLNIYYADGNIHVNGISESSLVKVNIYDMSSQLLSSSTKSIEAGVFVQEVPVNLSSGIYAVQVIVGNQVKSILVSVK